MIQWALEDEGLPVEVAVNGREALDVAARQQPALVVLDMVLPLLDGAGVASGLRDMYGGDVPILLITADGRITEKARQVGAHDFLRKPFEIDDLVHAVHRGAKRLP
jgi:CheY-like chemotaxis protein